MHAKPETGGAVSQMSKLNKPSSGKSDYSYFSGENNKNVIQLKFSEVAFAVLIERVSEQESSIQKCQKRMKQIVHVDCLKYCLLFLIVRP